MRKTVRKAIAKQATEAVREVLNHYQRWLMNLDGGGEERPADLIQEYGRVRKIRDYLRDLVRSQSQPEINLHPTDADLLASCCLFAVDCMEVEMREVGPRSSRFASLEVGIGDLVGLARELASGPIRWIDGPRRPLGPAMPKAREVIAELGMVEPEAQSDRSSIPSATLSPLTPVEPGAARGPHFLRADEFPDTLWGERPAAKEEQASTPIPEVQPPPTLTPGLLERLVQNVRLRNLAIEDLGHYESAVGREDWRLGAAFLYSVFEAVVLDQCLERREQLELPRRHEQWEIEDVVPRICQEPLSPAELRSLAHLVDCRDYLFPRAHLSAPVMVTRTSLRKMREFVLRLIGKLEVHDAGKRDETSVAARSVRR